MAHFIVSSNDEQNAAINLDLVAWMRRQDGVKFYIQFGEKISSKLHGAWVYDSVAERDREYCKILGIKSRGCKVDLRA